MSALNWTLCLSGSHASGLSPPPSLVLLIVTVNSCRLLLSFIYTQHRLRYCMAVLLLICNCIQSLAFLLGMEATPKQAMRWQLSLLLLAHGARSSPVFVWLVTSYRNSLSHITSLRKYVRYIQCGKTRMSVSDVSNKNTFLWIILFILESEWTGADDFSFTLHY